ncbi:MAG: hypothetical protein LBI48_11430 [Burkholderiaceae bacterium]|jgi:hypothetical protein|nr:hypothetical protein [Burkholderiaceae bacterium]
MDQKIAYEKHPISPEREKELRSQGFIIIDKRFEPKSDEVKASVETLPGDVHPGVQVDGQGLEPVAEQKRRGRPPKAK